MKKVITGKLYNTDTANLIAEYWNGLGNNDFKNQTETLYRTKKGNWFLYGNGGAMSRWCRVHGDNSRSQGEGIEPLTAKQALQWLEEQDEVKAIEKYFAKEIVEA